ncbi:hypothetical protein ScPMuIL_012485 [Solemya velum]
MHAGFIFALALLACIVTLGHFIDQPKHCKGAYYLCKGRSGSWCRTKRTLCMRRYCKQFIGKTYRRRCFLKYVMPSALKRHLPLFDSQQN